ncbi:hypothetical protein [Elizabethkingia meningoseptica]|uniref:hypothetical protein n=1 Tax=Elizabethkingia meningoseptica TaxID=238 RepID=UPI0021A2EAB6|nr:hypothetical protein [Elizabethkingia meningoseptica]WBS75411.1 hypothetical protein PF438_02740 [Elizabethkingia meningoseptica]
MVQYFWFYFGSAFLLTGITALLFAGSILLEKNKPSGVASSKNSVAETEPSGLSVFTA